MGYWRTPETAALYAVAREKHLANPVDIRENTLVQAFEHWVLVVNNFPYDAVLTTHHMLIPTRDGVPTRDDLSTTELEELAIILREHIEPRYDIVFENMPVARTILTQFHLHVGIVRNLNPRQ